MGAKYSLLSFREGGKRGGSEKKVLHLSSASVTLGGHMVGCGPDPQRGCIPGMAIGSVGTEMPNPLLPQFPHTAVSPA